MRWKKALGRNIINTSTAESAGKVEGFVVDPTRQAIVAIISGDGIIDWTDTGGIGPDAVTSGGNTVAREPSSDVERRASNGAGDPIGKPLLTEYGFALGTVGDVDFDPESGALNHLILGDDDLKGSRLMGIGPHAVIVASSDKASSAGDRIAHQGRALRARQGQGSGRSVDDDQEGTHRCTVLRAVRRRPRGHDWTP